MAGIIGQLVVVTDQRRINQEQRTLIERQARAAVPLLEEARPLVRKTLAQLPEARRIAGNVDSLTAHATPLVRDLRAAGLDSAARAMQRLVAELLAADVGGALRSGDELAHALLEVDAPKAVASIRDSAALLPQLVRLQRRALRVQRRSFAIQRRTFGTARQTLAVARETEKHAESLDRKLGGTQP